MPPKRRSKKSSDPLSSPNGVKKTKTDEIEEVTISFVDDDTSPVKKEKQLESSESDEELLQELPEKKRKNPVKRGTYSKYDKEDLFEAVKMVKTKKLSQNMAAKYYNIPKCTIRNYVLYDGRDHKKRGVEPALKPEEEQQILSWLMDGSDMGDPRTREDLLQAAIDVLKMNNRSNVFKNGIPTTAWITKFTNRHKKNVRLRKGEFNEDKFFRKFYAFLQKNDYLDVLKRPDAFYIIEDVNFELDPEKISSERRMFLRKSLMKKSDEPSQYRLQESVTVTYGFGANGRILQQLLTYRESFKDMVKVALADKEINAKFLFTRTPDGGNTRDTLKCYLEKIDQSQLRDVERPIFIFCSETLPHVSVELSQWCNERKIYVISFIPNVVSALFTIDDRIFGYKNTKWIKEIENYLEEKNLTKFTEVDFVKVLKMMNERVIQVDKILDAFQEAGIYPFDVTKLSSDDNDIDSEEEEQSGVKKKSPVDTLVSKMKEDSQELIRLLKNDKREDLVLNVRIITQQLDILESFTGN